MIEKALRGSKKYWLWLGFLATIAGIGVFFYVDQLWNGLGITGMSRDVSWGFYLANFTFFVGVAASGVMLVLPHYLHDQKEFGKITILGEFLAVVACGMCITFVTIDLGRPDRVVNLFLYPTPNSILFFDIVVLSGYLVINAIVGWSILDAESKGEKPRKFVKPLIYLSIPWAASIHTVTAFIYSGLAGRPFWLSAIMAPRFLATAFAAGPALLIIICLILRKTTDFDPGKVAIKKLSTIVTYATIAGFFFLLCEFFTAFYSGGAEHTATWKYLLFGEGGSGLQPYMWGVLISTMIAIALLVNPKTRARHDTLAIACVLVFFSIWIDKGLLLVIPGFIPNPLHEFTQYWPTGKELAITFGVWALGFMVLTLLYKIAISVKLEIGDHEIHH
ncbi:MAG: NrfD/PsrC family molybdoenzyme membrane anchor subunit [Dehalococcoidia bacterium]